MVNYHPCYDSNNSQTKVLNGLHSVKDEICDGYCEKRRRGEYSLKKKEERSRKKVRGRTDVVLNPRPFSTTYYMY